MASSTTSHFAEARRLDALVFIDGVEVPFSWLEVAFTTDGPSQATIAIESDPIVDQWRPKSLVHIFIRKPFDSAVPDEAKQLSGRKRDKDFDEKSFALYWEGELTALKDSEAAQSRTTLIQCTDLWNIPLQAPLSLAGIGVGLQVPILNGSTFFAGAVDPNGDALPLVLQGLVAYLFGVDAEQAVKAAKAKQDKKKDSPEDAQKDLASRLPTTLGVTGGADGTANMSDLMQLLLQYLAIYNASYGLQAFRTKLFDKITSISDSTLGKFIEQAQAAELITLMSAQLNASTVGGLMFGLLQKFFHHTISIPFPVPVTADKVVGFRSMAVVPNLYYSIPPFCNWLFPDQYQQRDVDRYFMNEPTRLGLKTGLTDAIGDTVHLAPASLQDRITGLFTKDTTSRQAFGTQDGTTKTVVRASDSDLGKRFAELGFYAAKADGNPDRAINLLAFLQADELEKGVVYHEDSNEYQSTLARAAANARTNLTSKDKTENRTKYKDLAKTPGSYPYFMRLLAEYQLMFRKLSRTIGLAGPFNPWPVVGLPMFVVRQNRSYRGLLVGLVSRIDYGGQSQTSYQIEYGQLVRPDYLSDATLARIDTANSTLRRAQAAVPALVATNQLTSEAAAVDTYDQLSKAAKAVAQAVDRVALSVAYGAQRDACRALADDPSGVLSGAGALYVLRVYAGLIGQVSTRPVHTSITEGVEDVVTRAYQSIGQPENERAVITQQFDRLFDKQNSSAVFQQYTLNISVLYELIGLFYNTTSAQQLASGNSSDTDAYVDVLADAVAERPSLERRRSELQQQIETLEAAEGAAIVTENEMLISARHELSEVNRQLAAFDTALSSKISIDWLTTLEGWRLSFAQLSAVPGDDPTKYDQSLTSLWNTLTVARHAAQAGTLAASTKVSAMYTLSQFRALARRYISMYELFARRPQPPALEPPTRSEDFATTINRVAFSAFISQLATEFLQVTSLMIDREQADAANAFRDAVVVSLNALGAVTADVATRALDIPPVFPFVNQALTDVASIDQALEKLIQPESKADGTYQARLAGAQLASTQAFDEATRSENPDVQRDTIIRYEAFIRIARKVFPLTDGDNNTEYQDHRTAGDVHAWANRVQARKTVSLADFIGLNSLQLTPRTVESPFGPGTYYVLGRRSFTGATVGSDEESEALRALDLSGYFSKFGVRPSEGDTMLARSLDQVRGLVAKDSAARKILGEAGRQALIIAYTERHAVPAAYQGKK